MEYGSIEMKTYATVYNIMAALYNGPFLCTVMVIHLFKVTGHIRFYFNDCTLCIIVSTKSSITEPYRSIWKSYKILMCVKSNLLEISSHYDPYSLFALLLIYLFCFSAIDLAKILVSYIHQFFHNGETPEYNHFTIVLLRIELLMNFTRFNRCITFW